MNTRIFVLCFSVLATACVDTPTADHPAADCDQHSLKTDLGEIVALDGYISGVIDNEDIQSRPDGFSGMIYPESGIITIHIVDVELDVVIDGSLLRKSYFWKGAIRKGGEERLPQLGSLVWTEEQDDGTRLLLVDFKDIDGWFFAHIVFRVSDR